MRIEEARPPEEWARRNAWWAAALAALVGGAYFALAGGEPGAVGDDNSQAPVVTVITPGRTTVAGIIEAPGTLAARRPMPVGAVSMNR